MPNSCHILKFPLNEMMVQADMLYKIIAIDSLEDRTVASRESKMP